MSRHNNFDAIRLLAALAVMVSHAFALSGQPEPRPYAGQTLGTFAVFVFFAISGYLVSASWRSDPNIKRFLTRRMLRIAPAYVIVIAVTEAFMRVVGIQDFSMNPLAASNGSLWTIPVEVQCYLLLMVLAATVRHGAIAMVALLLFLGTDGLFKQLAGFFAVAALISDYAALGKKPALLAFIAFGLLMILLSHIYYGMVLITVPLVIMVGKASWPVLREAGRHGDFSYGVYLYAFPAQQIIIMLLGKDQPYFLLFGTTLAITSMCAWLSWHYIEHPALGLKGSLNVFRPTQVVVEPAIAQ